MTGKANAPPPLLLAARGAPYCNPPPRRASADRPRARGTPRARTHRICAARRKQGARTRGPRRLATSRLVEVRFPPSRCRATAGKPQVRQSDGVPRAVFEACSANVPGSRPLRRCVGCFLPLRTGRLGRSLLTSVRPLAVRALDPYGERAGRFAAWTAGPWGASPPPRHSPATAPRPLSEMLQTPLGAGRDSCENNSPRTIVNSGREYFDAPCRGRSFPLPRRSRMIPTSATLRCPNAGKPAFGWGKGKRECRAAVL
jgi:hypothetical protein